MRKRIFVLPLMLGLCMILASCTQAGVIYQPYDTASVVQYEQSFALDDVPDFDSSPYVVIDDNVPSFGDDVTTDSFEHYGELDALGRCTTAIACIGRDTMPTAERGSIGSVKPTGWHTVKYDNIDGKYLYNRCHLIGYQLTAENANERNLITGTRYLNVEGMLPFEDLVADYVKSTDNHVMYSVTPIFDGDDMVARGVHMQAYSVEDNGSGVSYNVYCYNNQPGIIIDYATGDSVAGSKEYDFDDGAGKHSYVVNTSSKRFHTPDCGSVGSISDGNKKTYYGYRSNLVNNGYTPCGKCNP